MKITFKLYASLAQHLPPEAAGGNEVQIDVAPQDRATRTLQEGDVLAIWPPIAGG